MVFGQSAELDQSRQGLWPPVLHEKKTGCLGCEEGADAPDDGGELPLQTGVSLVSGHALVDEAAEDGAELLAASILQCQKTTDRMPIYKRGMSS